MFNMLIIGILFSLSLLGAVILFKFFKSSAIIKNKQYQAGGAIAGFIIIFGVLYASYDNIEKRKYNELKTEHEQLKNDYHKLSETLSIRGKIDPYRGENTRIIIATKEVNPDSFGKFQLQTPCIDIKDGASLYIIREGKKPFQQYLFEGDNTNNLTININE